MHSKHICRKSWRTHRWSFEQHRVIHFHYDNGVRHRLQSKQYELGMLDHLGRHLCIRRTEKFLRSRGVESARHCLEKEPALQLVEAGCVIMTCRRSKLLSIVSCAHFADIARMLPIRTIYFFGASGKLDGNGGTDAAGLAASQRFFEKTKIF